MSWVVQEHPNPTVKPSIVDGSDDSDDDKYEYDGPPEIPKGEKPTVKFTDEHGKERKSPINFESRF